MNEWQPNATAPRDGKSILITMAGGDDGPYWVVYWNGRYWESVESGNKIDTMFWTHWMPLPEPPVTSHHQTKEE